MPATVKPIPTGYETVTPYLAVRGAAKAIDFYKQALGATELMRIAAPGGKIGHAEIRIGAGIVMLADEHPEMGHRGPQALGGSPVGLALYVADVDTVVARAVKAGAKLTRPLENKFYGDRSAQIEDPFGHTWYLATHIEDVSPEEMAKRAAKLHGG